MKLFMVCIYDKRAQEFAPPMCQHTLGTAERTFTDLANDPQSPVNKHPEDYELWHVGHYDTEEGKVEHAEHRIICTAHQVMALKQ